MGGIQKVTEDKQVYNLDQLERVREGLSSIFAGKSPNAHSADGQFFQFESPISSAVRTGSYVVIAKNDGEKYLGQIMGQNIIEREGPEYGLSLRHEGLFVLSERESHFRDRLTIRLLKGHGLLLGTIVGDTFEVHKELSRFQDALLSEAPAEIVDQYFSQIRPSKGAADVGTPVHGTKKCRVFLNAGNFNRHTFLTGQSRSGKSFAMGVILEQLLLKTSLRLIVIDPNSDFAKLSKLRELEGVNKVRPVHLSSAEYNEVKDNYASRTTDVSVLGMPETPDEKHKPLRVRFSELTAVEKPAVLRLDPLQNRQEFHHLQKLLDGMPAGSYSIDEVRNAAKDGFDSPDTNIALRIENLGIRKWQVWAKKDERSLIEILNEKRRCTVVDIGSLASEDEKLLASMVVLGHFWESRARREPVLIVIDEAHNVAPSNPASELQRVCSDLIVRIAGEGLKYCIHLMVATQRPGKLNPNVMSQCDNQIVMRMMSSADLATVTEAFSQIPASLMQECAKFETGNALIAGRIAPAPTFVKFDGRLSEEGGADVAVNWVD